MQKTYILFVETVLEVQSDRRNDWKYYASITHICIEDVCAIPIIPISAETADKQLVLEVSPLPDIYYLTVVDR